jgi:uncharacterized damage-inducible protein DinB
MEESMGETDRIWDMLQRAYAGNAWHGPGLRELLLSVTAEQASARPVPKARTIWETARHLTACEDAVRRRLLGEPVGELPPDEDWPAVEDNSASAWARTLDEFESGHVRLREALARFPDQRLDDVVPGRDYPFYLMLHGVVEHELYHSGQIVVLMQAQGLTPRG